MDLEEFASNRSERLLGFEREIREIVAAALDRYGQPDWYDDIVEGASVLYLEIFEQHSPTGDPSAPLERFQRELSESLQKTSQPEDPPTDGQIDRITRWIGVFAVNAATYFAARDAGKLEKVWITREDERVRPLHRAVDGQSVPILGTFQVGDFKLHYPGEPVGPPEIWINCRCLLAAEGGIELATVIGNLSAAVEPAVDEEPVVDEAEDADEEYGDDEPTIDEVDEIPWHGVIVVEGVPTGDKRQFDKGSLTYRNLPLPIKYQRASSDGHKGDVTVGTIDEIWREGDEHRARGRLNPNVPETAEVVDGIVFGTVRGVSVDVDDAEFEIDMKEPDEKDTDNPLASLFTQVQLTRFTKGRIAGASIVSIPAFQEAYIALGPDFDEELRDPEAGVGDADGEVDADTELSGEQDAALSALEEALATGDQSLVAAAYQQLREISAEERRRMADDGQAMPDGSFPIANEDDLRNAIQAIGRAKDPEAAKRHIKKRAKALGKEDLIPEEWAVEHIVAAAFAPGTKDGPGWITHPIPTERIRRYWVKGKGRAKIRWGVPGDFNRCRRQLAKYVRNPQWLAGTCANMHKEAIGVWPGRENGRGRHSLLDAAPSFSLVAAAVEEGVMPKAWFADPKFDALTPFTVLDDGRVYGHLAGFGTCHIGFDNVCILPPRSATNYAMFHTGEIDTDEGPVAVGQITIGTGHAGPKLSRQAAVEHYDNTGTAIADVRAGEDRFGIWVAGALREDADPLQVKKLRAAALSGDWRYVNGNLELVGALAVNVPGFPIPRTGFAMEGDRQMSLVAGGVVIPEEGEPLLPQSRGRLSADELLMISRAVADEQEYRAEKRARLAAARDPELIALAEARRAARIAAAKTLE